MKLCRTVHCSESPTPWMRQFTLGAGKLSNRRSCGESIERTKYGVAKDRLSSAPFVSMVQAAHPRDGNDTTVLRSIDGSRLGGVFHQG
jgi:hypothetical protein